MSDQTVLALANIVRAYGDLVILDGADLTIARGEMVALLGPSGSGKSSLLHVAGLLEAPSSGRVLVEGQDVSNLSDDARTGVRREQMGFVYQFHHLLPEFSAQRNVEFPMLIAGVSPKKAEARAVDLLTRMGLKDRLHHQPAELSGGEKQRVAIARALANNPSLLLADEPTGNLDVDTAVRVFEALQEIVSDQGLCAMVATHDQALAAKMDRTVVIKDKKLVAA
ncbi:MAG: ABC transporter ATP-binding protein [Pseudomonadota bacterium]